MKASSFGQQTSSLGKGQAGMSLLEVLVALAVLSLIAAQVSMSFTSNLEARSRNERQTKFMAVDSALRSAVFRRFSAYSEKNTNCAKPKASLTTLWKSSEPTELRLSPLSRLKTGTHPPAMLRRCQRQSLDAPLVQGIYQCFSLSPGVGGDGRRFLAENEVFAETFFAYWDVTRDRPTTCAAFNDAKTPVRGARLHYVLYWRPRVKDKASGGDRRFSSFAGIMYGQTKSKD